MSSPSASPEITLWDSIGDMNYDMLMKNMAGPMSPPSTSDEESEATSPAPSTAADTPKSSEDKKDDEKKPVKKRKSWGQELPTPTTNLPPRKRAKTEAEKEQRRIERVLRNRAAAHSSRERKRAEQEALEKRKKEIEVENVEMKARISQFEQEFADLQKKYKQLEHNYLLAKSHLPAGSAFIPQSLPEEKTIASDNVAMADVQALSPQSLLQSPAVKSEDDIRTPPTVPSQSISTPVLNTTQHHATISIDLGLLKSDVISTETVDNLWTDWTLFDESSLNACVDSIGHLSSPDSDSLSTPIITSDDMASNSLPASSFPELDMNFDFFGLGKDDKNSVDMSLDLFGEPISVELKDL
ncbi:hypothetical protein AA313_de0201425 [Arthrobotrys entomopaga]|nr:hypothetical protein AA313_de0201425 [Arthrobotrys entomopaga]